MDEDKLLNFTVDLDMPLVNPRTTQVDQKILDKVKEITIKGYVCRFSKEYCKRYRKYMTKAFGKGSVAQRAIPSVHGGVQYRLWRLR